MTIDQGAHHRVTQCDGGGDVMPQDFTDPPPDRVYSPGDQAWFEYHCLESLDSADADLWLRSHQRVTVTSPPETNDAPEGSTFVERIEAGTPWTYTITFADGHRGCAVEDELMDSTEQFCRPDPPEREV